MSEEEDRFKLTTVDLPPEAFAKFVDAINNPKPPTQALIDLMKSASPWDKPSSARVLIYTDTSKQVGDPDHLKVFADESAADEWFRENDKEGVAFAYRMIG